MRLVLRHFPLAGNFPWEIPSHFPPTTLGTLPGNCMYIPYQFIFIGRYYSLLSSCVFIIIEYKNRHSYFAYVDSVPPDFPGNSWEGPKLNGGYPFPTRAGGKGNDATLHKRVIR